MLTTRYFREQVLRKRPYLSAAWIRDTVAAPEFIEIETGGRIRHWRYIEELGRYLRVVTLADGVTVHNAFPDRTFRGRSP